MHSYTVVVSYGNDIDRRDRVTQITLYQSLRNLAREHDEVCNATVKEFGLNATHYRALSVIGDHGPITSSNVARHMWCAYEASAAHAIAHLRGRGYVIREERRGHAKPLMITQSGMDILAKCTRAMDAAEVHMRRFISTATADGITAAHARMISWYEINA